MTREPGRASWLLPDAVLAAVVVLLLVAAGVLLGRGDAAATGEQGRTETLSRRYDEVTRAARAEATAFLSVDHRDPGASSRRVLDGATGMFARQYRGNLPDLESSTRERQAVAEGEVRSVGVVRLTDSRAEVLVAADSQVTNSMTRGQAQPRYYRLALVLVRQRDRWLTSSLRFVG